MRACVRGLQYFAGNRCEVAASTPPSSPRATKSEAKADKDAKELAEYRRVKKMLGVLPSEDGSVVLKPLESIAPLVLRELSEHDKDYLTRSPPVLRATPTVPRKTGGPGEAPVFKRAAAAQMNIECCRSPQLVAMCLVLGHIYWTGKVPPPLPLACPAHMYIGMCLQSMASLCRHPSRNTFLQ